MFIYSDGKFIQADTSRLHSLTPGIVCGEGAFETLRIQNKNILHLDLHLQRLHRGLNRFHIGKRMTSQWSTKVIQKLLTKNNYTNARCRISVWKLEGKIHVACVVQKLGRLPKEYRLCVAQKKRPLTKYSHLKSIQYHVFRQARLEAQAKGFDDALLVNAHGHVVEATSANIFWFKGNHLKTPAISCGCLNGITRARVLSAARVLGLKVEIGSFKFSSLRLADACFVTNSLFDILPVKSLESKSYKKNQLLLALTRQISL